MPVLVIETVGDRWNRLMLKLGECVGLAREIFIGLYPLGLVDEMIDHLLDCARTISQAAVAGQVDHSHAAAAEQPLDRIAALEQGSGVERAGHGICCISHPSQFANTTTTETLSVPPPAFAAAISSRAASSGLLWRRRIRAISGSSTCAVSPSLQSNIRSP